MNITDYPFLVHHNKETQELCYSLSYLVAEKTADSKCVVGPWAALLVPAQAVDTLVRAGRAFISPTGCFVAHVHNRWENAQTLKQKCIIVLLGAVGEFVIILATPINVAIQTVIELGHLLKATLGMFVGFCAPRSNLFIFLAEIDRNQGEDKPNVNLDAPPDEAPHDEPVPIPAIPSPSAKFVSETQELLEQNEITTSFSGEAFEMYKGYILHFKENCKEEKCPLFSSNATLGPALFVTASIVEASFKEPDNAVKQISDLNSYLTEKNRMPAFHPGERTESRGSIQTELSTSGNEQYSSFFVEAVTDLLQRTITQESYREYAASDFSYVIHYYSYGIETLCAVFNQPFDREATKTIFWNTLISKEFIKERPVENSTHE